MMKAKKMLAYLIAASCILGHVTVPVYADEVPASTVDTEETEISENEKETETIIPEEAQEALPQEGVLEAEALESNIGTTPDTATKITFGETYSDHWDSSSANFHYLTFTTSARGIVNLKAAKPVSSGEYQVLRMVLYNSDGTEIWSFYAANEVSDSKSYYDVSVGLAAGTYIMGVAPITHNVDTSYRFTFTKNAYTELEPNDSQFQATAMTLGKTYTGFFGNDQLETEFYDYYKFSVVAGESYRIVMSEGLESLGTAGFYLLRDDGYYYALSEAMRENIDADGNPFFEFSADESGTWFLCFDGCPRSAQFMYCIKVCKNPVADFVTRLYDVCLGRTPDDYGKLYWMNALGSGTITGVEAAYGFVFSQEFKNKNLCNSDYVEALYKAFMGRSSDAAGKADWVGRLNSGQTREEVFNGFALSQEFGKICTNAGIVQGSGISIPKYGTVPTGKCKVCGKEDGVTSFVKRLYKVCLNREADAGGLEYWTTRLWNHTDSGSGVAYGFIFSDEFVKKNYSDSQYVEYLYQAFMGRSSDAAGKADWLARLKSGWTRKQVFDGFVGSQEFTKICQSYGITRD